MNVIIVIQLQIVKAVSQLIIFLKANVKNVHPIVSLVMMEHQMIALHVMLAGI